MQTRYLLSSLSGRARKVAQAARAHGGIENGLHYVLDVVFDEDASRIRKDHAPENFAPLRHIAINLIKQEKTTAASVKTRRKPAAWDERYLEKLRAI